MGRRFADKIPEQQDGVRFYAGAGRAFFGCGIGWLLLTGFIAALPQDHEKYDLPLFFAALCALAALHLLLGAVLLLLSKRSKRFQRWANRDYDRARSGQLARRLRREGQKARRQAEKAPQKGDGA